MLDQIVLEDGPTVRVHARPAQGTRHEILFGSLPQTNEPVVVKLERIPGALDREREALAWLETQGGPAPRLRAAGTAMIDGQHLACLITERRSGEPPTATEGWRRMGRALARLADLPLPSRELPILDPINFGQQHAQRVSDLGERMAPLGRSVTDWEDLASAQLPASNPVVVTHGDPGPGNYLDDGHDGTLIDWEEAHIAPRGLDLARLVFIALLGAGPSRYLARDHRSRADAAVDGYLTTLRNPWQPSRDESRWWITVAGIQFVHRRWQLGGQPAPWEQAADVLGSALTDDVTWAAG